MKRQELFKATLTLTMAVTMWASASPLAWATSEIDAEMDRLAVELKPAPTPSLNPAKVKHAKVAKNSNSQQSEIPSQEIAAPPAQEVSSPEQIKAQQAYESLHTSKPRLEISSKKPSLFSRFTLLSEISLSTLDGQDQGSVAPSNGGSGYNTGFAGGLLADLNFGSQKVVLETGIGYYHLSPNAGYGNAYLFSSASTIGRGDETLTFQYIGVPINIKWLFSGEEKTSFYVKGGVIAATLLSSQYQNLSGPAYVGYRYGNYSGFDAILDAAVGIVVPVYHSFGVDAEAGYFHGTVPVSSNYNIYNTGFTGGLGLTYSL